MAILTRKQTKAIDYLEDSTTTELLFGGGAGGAKSFLGCYWQIKNRLKYPNTRGLIGRSKLKTLKDTTLKTFFEVCKLQGLSNGEHYNYNSQTSTIKFNNESEIILKDLFAYPSDPNFDELGSLEITDAFIDEANQITVKARNIIKSRIRFNLDKNGLIPKILYTCNPAKNWVYNDFYKPNKENDLVKGRKFVQALVTDNPFISKHYIDNLSGLDHNSRQRLQYGNWEYDDDPMSLIEDYDSILELFTNPNTFEGKKYITADVARYGSDKAVIMVWDGWNIIEIFTFDLSSTVDVENKIKQYQLSYGIPNKNVIVDQDGVGGGVMDHLRCQGFANNSKAIEVKGSKENYNNIKSQCGFGLAKKINDNLISIKYNCDVTLKEKIIEELEVLKRKEDVKLRLISKDEMKELIGRSPDYLDCMLMRYYFELGYNKIKTKIGVNR